MSRLQSYTQGQLASSVVGVPGVDRSGEIIAGALQKVSGDFANFQIQDLQRRTEAEDSLAINAISESRDVAKLEMLKVMKTQSVDTWENELGRISQEQQKVYIGKTLSKGKAAIERVKQKGFETSSKLIVQMAATKQKQDNATVASGQGLIKTVSDPLATPEEITEQKDLHMNDLLQQFSKEIADIRFEETFREATIEKYDSQAVLFPDETIKKSNEKLDELREGKIDEDGLTAVDWDRIRDSARMELGTKKEFEGKVYQKAVQDNAGELLDFYIEGDMSNIVVHDENIGEFNQLADKIANQATDIGDDFESETIRENLESGKIVENDEMLDNAGVLSREQLNEAMELNKQNKKMAGKRSLVKNVVGRINTKFGVIDKEIDNQIGLAYNPEQAALLSKNLMEWKQELVKNSRSMIVDGKDPTEILTKINEAFEITTEGILETGWNQIWKSAEHDFVDFLETGIKDGKTLSKETLDKYRRQATVNLIMAGEHGKIEAMLDVGWLD